MMKKIYQTPLAVICPLRPVTMLCGSSGETFTFKKSATDENTEDIVTENDVILSRRSSEW